MNIELIETERGVKELVINNKSIGEFIMWVDGYYYFWFNPGVTKGSWNSNALRLIADKQDELNAEMDKHVTNYFKNENPV
jgi:hypothetical protein